MTRTVTLTLPASWLANADSLALYPMQGVRVLDIISFDLVDGQPVPRVHAPELDPTHPEGDPHAATPA